MSRDKLNRHKKTCKGTTVEAVEEHYRFNKEARRLIRGRPQGVMNQTEYDKVQSMLKELQEEIYSKSS